MEGERHHGHHGLLDAAAGAAAGAFGEHLWDKHEMRKEEERQARRLEEQGPVPGGGYGYTEERPRHEGLMEAAGGVVAGALGERMWDEHKEKRREGEVEVGRAQTEGPYVEGGYGTPAGYGAPGMGGGGFGEERRREGYGEERGREGYGYQPGPRLAEEGRPEGYPPPEAGYGERRWEGGPAVGGGDYAPGPAPGGYGGPAQEYSGGGYPGQPAPEYEERRHYY